MEALQALFGLSTRGPRLSSVAAPPGPGGGDEGRPGAIAAQRRCNGARSGLVLSPPRAAFAQAAGGSGCPRAWERRRGVTAPDYTVGDK